MASVTISITHQEVIDHLMALRDKNKLFLSVYDSASLGVASKILSSGEVMETYLVKIDLGKE